MYNNKISKYKRSSSVFFACELFFMIYHSANALNRSSHLLVIFKIVLCRQQGENSNENTNFHLPSIDKKTYFSYFPSDLYAAFSHTALFWIFQERVNDERCLRKKTMKTSDFPHSPILWCFVRTAWSFFNVSAGRSNGRSSGRLLYRISKAMLYGVLTFTQVNNKH